MRSARLVPAAAGALLLLAACSNGDDAAPSTAPTTAAERDGGSQTKEAAPPAGGEDCLEGEWVAGEDGAAQLEEAFGAETPVEVTIEGDAVTAFAGGTVTSTYEDQVTTITMDVEGQELVVVSTISGSTSGDYSVDGETIRITGVDPSALDISQRTTVDGEELDLPMVDLDQLAEQSAGAMEGSMTFTCAGDELTLTPEGEEMAEFSQTLTRR